MRPIHAFELASVALFGYRALSNFQRSAETSLDAAALPQGCERRVVERAAGALSKEGYVNAGFAIGLLGLSLWTWDRPWTRFDVLRTFDK